MQPGGKIEDDEEPASALIRELREELGLVVSRTNLIYLGRCVASAANEPGYLVDAELFRVIFDGDVRPAAEIEEIIWVDPGASIVCELAPLTRDHVLPHCAA